MPNVVTFSLFLGLSISSCAVWASAWLHQQQSKAASIFRMTSSLRAGGRRVQCARIAATAMGLNCPGDQHTKDARSGFICQAGNVSTSPRSDRPHRRPVRSTRAASWPKCARAFLSSVSIWLVAVPHAGTYTHASTIRSQDRVRRNAHYVRSRECLSMACSLMGCPLVRREGQPATKRWTGSWARPEGTKNGRQDAVSSQAFAKLYGIIWLSRTGQEY